MLNDIMQKTWALSLVETLEQGSDLSIWHARVCDDLYVSHCCKDDPILPIFEDLLLFTDSLMSVAMLKDIKTYDINHTAGTLELVDLLISAVRLRLMNEYGYSIQDVYPVCGTIARNNRNNHDNLAFIAQYN